MTPDDEPRVVQALVDADGPPELAPQLVAIARDRGALLSDLINWIGWHRSEEWTAQSFARYCDRTNETKRLIEELRQSKEKRQCP